MSTAHRITYVIRVSEHLDDHWAGLLGGAVVTRGADGTSTLTCPLVDQAQLYGVLSGLRDIGATLLDVRSATPEDRVASSSACGPVGLSAVCTEAPTDPDAPGL